MGQEIFYCSGCQNQLRSSDFEKGKGYKLLGLEAICAKCAPEALKTLPPDKLQALRNAMAGPPDVPASSPKSGTSRVPLATSTPKAGTGRVPLATSTPKSGTGRVPLASSPASTRRIAAADGEKTLKPLLLGVGVVGLILIGALVTMSGRPAPDPGSRTPAPAPPDTPIVIPSPSPTPDPSRDRAVKDALRKAADYVEAHPAETMEQLRLYLDAAATAKGTGFEPEANRALETARRRIQDIVAAKLKTIDAQTREACAKEEFKRASDLLDDARKKPVSTEWPSEIDRRLQDVQAQMDTAFGRVRTQAVLAKPGSPEVKAFQERVAKWGSERLVADLDKALADAAAPKPDPTPAPAPTPAPPDAPKLPPAAEADAFAKAWTAALTLAYGRDFAPAIQELERVSPSLQDPVLKSQCAADLDALRAVAALHADAAQTLAKWPVGKKISWVYLDFDNNPNRIELPFLRVRDGNIEMTKGKSLSRLPAGHMTIRSICDFAPNRVRATAALACLVEGDLGGAKELGSENNPAIPARFWKWGADAAKPADPDTQKKEGDARYAYYFAVLNQGAPTQRAEAALRCRKLLDENGSLTWVRRNRAMLVAVADTTREYVAGPTTLRQVGMFRLEVPKTMPYWMCDRDIDPARRKENYVEMDYSVLTDATYRAWAYVGACCADSLVFYEQTSDLAGADPGGEPGEPVKHAITSATKNHAGHAGRKGPSKWFWVELPLPKYEKPGAKVLRLLTGTQGFSVAWMVVSSLRDKPPGDTEFKDWERDLVHNAGPVGPTIGLAAWWKADAGVVADGGKVAQWQDQSGHAHHAVQAAPAARPLLVANGLGGKPVLRFDGAANAMSFECPMSGQTGLTLIMVAGSSKNLAGTELGNYAAIQWTESGPWGAIFLSPQQAGVSWRFGSAQFGNMNGWGRPNESPKTPTVNTVRKDGAKEELFVQGVPALTAKDPRYPCIAHTQDVGTIGAGTDDRRNPLRFYAGDIAEILVFTRAITEAERDAIERYLRTKYGI